MNARKVIATLGAFAFVLTSQTAFSTTLSEAVVKALTTHPDVQIALERKNAIEQEFKQARAGFRPSVDFTAGTGFEHSDNATTRNRADRNGGSGHLSLWRNESRIAATQMLFDGFETDAEACQQRERFISSQYNIAEVEEITSLRAVEAYVEVLRTEALVNLAEENLATHEKYLNQIKMRSRSGRGSTADVRQAQSRVSLIRANMLSARGELRNAKATYLEIIGEAPTSIVRSITPLNKLPQNLADALARAMENNPALKSAQHDIQAVEEAVRATKGAFYPRFDAEIAASANHNLDGSRGDNDDVTAMLRMRYNLYRGGADTARKNEQVARLEEARDTLERDRRKIEENMYKAWNNYEVAKARLAPLSMHVTTSNQTRQAYKSQFDIGKRSLLDLLDSEVEFFEAKAAYITGMFAADFSAYEILATSGDLVNALSDEAPISTVGIATEVTAEEMSMSAAKAHAPHTPRKAMDEALEKAVNDVINEVEKNNG